MTTDRPPTPVTAVWTIPNAISALRIVLIFVFLYLLITERDAWAIAALVAAGVSDFLDGYLARKWNQMTNLGKVLDPAADRLLTVAVVLGLAVRDIIPWWLVAVLLARDVMVGVALLAARRKQIAAPDVTFIGKAATLAMYFVLPLAYLAYDRWDTVHTAALVLAIIVAALYWFAGVGYVRDIRDRLRAAPAPFG